MGGGGKRGGDGKGEEREREGVYFGLKFLKLVVFLFAVVVDFFLGFGAGVFDAFGAV